MIIADMIKCILSDKFGVVPQDDNAGLVKDLYMDSLEMVELCMELEKIFNIKIPDSDRANTETMTVTDLINYIEKSTGGEVSPSVAEFMTSGHDSKSAQKQKNNSVQSDVLQSKPEPVQQQSINLYTTTANGKAKCRLTGRPCQKITPDEITKNTKLLNLCRNHKCVIERNFQEIIQKIK